MTAPMPETMSPREKVARIVDSGAWPKVLNEQDPGDRASMNKAYDKADAILAALASSGDHAELARLAEAATPGPWFETEGHPSGRTYGIHAEAGPVVAFRGIAKPHGQGEHNAAFIAAANPSVVLALIAENAALRGENEHVKKLRHQAIDRSRLWEIDAIKWETRATEAERKLAEARSMLLRWRRHAPTEALEDLTDAWLSKEAERGCS